MGQQRACGADDSRGAEAHMDMGPDELLQGLDMGLLSELGPHRQLGHTGDLEFPQ